MAGLEGMSEDDENLERNASMKTWLVLAFVVVVVVVVYLSNHSFSRNYHKDK